MAIYSSISRNYGPPIFYKPPFPIPRASYQDIQLVGSPGGIQFLKNRLDNLEQRGDQEEWNNILAILALTTYYNPQGVWDTLSTRLHRAYLMFCAAGFADKAPIALYWPRILALLLYYHPTGKAIVDLARIVFLNSNSISRGEIMKVLCLSRDEKTIQYAMDTILLALKDPNEIVRAEAILSLIKCGCIPFAAIEEIRSCLNSPKTLIPAASALFHITGKGEYFTILVEEGESPNMEVAMLSAHALEPWPTRQCLVTRCHAPLEFKDYWREWRKHTSPFNFREAYHLWQSPAVKFFCCHCYETHVNSSSVTRCSPQSICRIQ